MHSVLACMQVRPAPPWLVPRQNRTVLSFEHDTSTSLTSVMSLTQSAWPSKLASNHGAGPPTFHLPGMHVHGTKALACTSWTIFRRLHACEASHLLMVESLEALNRILCPGTSSTDSTPEQCCKAVHGDACHRPVATFRAGI